jgi:hypothetical protein
MSLLYFHDLMIVRGSLPWQHKLTNRRWLFKRGRDEEAIQVLCQVFDLPRDDPYITSEIAAIKHAISIESGVKSHSALFKSDKLKTRRRIILAYFG